MNIHQIFTDSVEAFLTRNADLAETTFGRLAANDPNLVSNMREGRSIGLKLCTRISEWMKTYENKQCKSRKRETPNKPQSAAAAD